MLRTLEEWKALNLNDFPDADVIEEILKDWAEDKESCCTEVPYDVHPNITATGGTGIDLFSKCYTCGSILNKELVSCPENIIGCLVYHYKNTCPICDIKNKNKIR